MRTDLRFQANGVGLAAWLYRPALPGPRPALILSHGFSALMEMGLDDYARRFAAAGFICLVYNHRNFGGSEGTPRHDIDPWQQVSDMRDAISFLRTLPEVDPERLGLWGTSYAGGHALVVSALDRRVRCVVSQVPLVEGYQTLRSWTGDSWPKIQARFIADRDACYGGAAPKTSQPAREGSETWDWVQATDREKLYPNEITLRSLEMLGSYEPGQFIERISPTPLLMILAEHDEQTPFAGQLAAFDRAGHPRQLITLPCKHYDPYTVQFEPACDAACEWFVRHLAP